jgi:6-phosphogluconolactonase
VSVGQQQQNPRLTLTVPVFNHASCVLFLVAGVGKQTALGQIFNPESDPNQYPAKFIQPQGELIWLVDRAASLGLPPSP